MPVFRNEAQETDNIYLAHVPVYFSSLIYAITINYKLDNYPCCNITWHGKYLNNHKIVTWFKKECKDSIIFNNT